MSDIEIRPDTVLVLEYTNHRGETATRRVRPIRLWRGSTPWHLEEQMLLDAHDLGKNEVRTFAIAGVLSWRIEDE